MVKQCTKILWELLIKLMLLFQHTNLKIWDKFYVILVMETLLLDRENNSGRLLSLNLQDYFPKNLIQISKKWWKSYGEIIILTVNQKNGKKIQLIKKENQSVEHSLNLSWILFANYVMQLFKEENKIMKKCLIL